jgi:hypothetical protein
MKAIYKPVLAGSVLAVVGVGYFLFAHSRVESSPPTPQLVTAAQVKTHDDRLGQGAVVGPVNDDQGNRMPLVGPVNDDEGNLMPRPPSRIADGS